VLNAPARAKVLQFKLANVTALVSEMHCKLHDPFCQALNSPASNPKTDRTTGEEVEQFNSCASTWTNTRNMGSAASIEEITSNTMYWNRIKHQGQAKSLRERHDRTSTRLKEDESKLEAVKEELSRRFPTVDISFETAYRDHRVVAEEQSQRLRRLKKDAPVVEYLKLQQRLEDAKKLSDFVASSSNPERLVFDDDGTRLSLLHENAKAIVDDISRMEARVTTLKKEMLKDLKLPEGEELPLDHLKEAKGRAASEAMEKLQDDMEAYSRLCLNHRAVIDKAVKKDRDRFSKKISKLKATLKKVIKNYIEVSTIAPMGVAYRLEEDEDALFKSLMEGVYPWTEARAARHQSGDNIVKKIGVQSTMNLIEAHVRVMRGKNELTNLQEEAENYISYYLAKRDRLLQGLRNEIVSDLQEDAGTTDDDALEDNNLRYIATFADRRRCPAFFGGHSAIMKSAKAVCDLQVSRARDLWGHRFEVLASLGPLSSIAADTSICGECEDVIAAGDGKACRMCGDLLHLGCMSSCDVDGFELDGPQGHQVMSVRYTHIPGVEGAYHEVEYCTKCASHVLGLETMLGERVASMYPDEEE